ncbi:MAG: hypothetical protein KDA92_25970, partial [Planctomycetales bacterium]|nr:hypothetical protein [Planctomycetales bacterium]
GDGVATDNEPGLAGVTIYADLNHNGQLDADEPHARTQRDDPDTRSDETGNYVLENVPAGEVWVREVVPEGFMQTHPINWITPPAPFDPIPIDPANPDGDEFVHVEPPELSFDVQPGETVAAEVSASVLPYCILPVELDVVSADPDVRVQNVSGPQLNGCGGDTSFFKVEITAERVPTAFKLLVVDAKSGTEYGAIPVYVNGGVDPVPLYAHIVDLPPGEAVKGVDFGNMRLAGGGAQIEGHKWLDANGNGVRDGNEVGQGGVTIYVDLNRDGQWSRNEPSTITSYDDEFTDFDEGGYYRFDGLRAGEYVVREIVPPNYIQTYPGINGIVLSSETSTLHDGVAIDLDVTSVSAEQSDAAVPNSLSAKLEMTVVWPDSCGALIDGATSATVVGDHIIVSLTGHQVGDACNDVISPESTTVAVENLHMGVYDVVVVLNEDLREARLATLTAVGQVEIGGPGAHVVTLAEGELVSEIDFGNYSTLRPGSIRGTKWLDANGDGAWQREEKGLGGVTIYIDANHNMQW